MLKVHEARSLANTRAARARGCLNSARPAFRPPASERSQIRELALIRAIRVNSSLTHKRARERAGGINSLIRRERIVERFRGLQIFFFFDEKNADETRDKNIVNVHDQHSRDGTTHAC